ncbi:unnamed protein product, partial [Gadus morhua 'NCC']
MIQQRILLQRRIERTQCHRERQLRYARHIDYQQALRSPLTDGSVCLSPARRTCQVGFL